MVLSVSFSVNSSTHAILQMNFVHSVMIFEVRAASFFHFIHMECTILPSMKIPYLQVFVFFTNSKTINSNVSLLSHKQHAHEYPHTLLVPHSVSLEHKPKTWNYQINRGAHC